MTDRAEQPTAPPAADAPRTLARPDTVVIHDEGDDSPGDARLSLDAVRDCIRASGACISQ
jgi:hypothetical protein